jgi:hypothetical protein
MIFDGWACINSTKAGAMAQFQCPPFEHFNFHSQSKSSSSFKTSRFSRSNREDDDGQD